MINSFILQTEIIHFLQKNKKNLNSKNVHKNKKMNFINFVMKIYKI
jgi:hypothetical protein